VSGEEGRAEELEAFVEGIEAALRVHRGVDHALSPRDFALARAWYEAGVPLATVLVGIDLETPPGPYRVTIETGPGRLTLPLSRSAARRSRRGCPVARRT